MTALFGVHFAITWALIGAVWFVLVIHYPSFRLFPEAAFPPFEAFHIRRMNYFILPMVVEALTALLLLIFYYNERGWPLLLLNALLLALIWVLTLSLCLPIHLRLKKEGFSSCSFNRLIHIHLIRVILWTLRGCLLFVFLDAP